MTCEDASNSNNFLHDLKKLFIDGEAKFLLACLAKGFDPSFIIAGQSNLEIALAFKSIKKTGDFLGAATSSSQAIDLLDRVRPGFVFIHERTEAPQYADLAR